MIILVKLRLSLDGLGEYPHLKGYGLYDRLSPVHRYKACYSMAGAINTMYALPCCEAVFGSKRYIHEYLNIHDETVQCAYFPLLQCLSAIT